MRDSFNKVSNLDFYEEILKIVPYMLLLIWNTDMS